MGIERAMNTLEASRGSISARCVGGALNFDRGAGALSSGRLLSAIFEEDDGGAAVGAATEGLWSASVTGGAPPSAEMASSGGTTGAVLGAIVAGVSGATTDGL